MRRWGSIIIAFAVTCLVALTLAAAPRVALAGGYHVTQVWGEAGEGDDRLQVPKGVAVAPDGSVWVVDYHNETLLKYASTGELLGCWGRHGGAPGEFRRPSRVAVGPDGTVYVTDATNHRIQCFSQSGRFLRQWGEPGTGRGQFSYPRGVGIGPDGSVYITDQVNRRVQVFTASGTYLRQWGKVGDGRGRFRAPKDIAVSTDGRAYVVDAETHRVQIYTTTGKWLGSFGGEGSAPGRFSGPRGLDVDARGHVYVADAMNHRIQEFTGAGEFVREWGLEGPAAGLLQAPRDVAAAPDGSLVVVDTYNHRLQRFVRDESADDEPPVTSCDGPSGWASGAARAHADRDRRRERDRGDLRARGRRQVPRVGGALEFRSQGRHVVRYASVDAAGNQERIRRLAFALDWTAPGVRFGIRAPLRALAGATVRPGFSVADALSADCRVWIRLERDDEQVWLRSLGAVVVSPSGRDVRPAIAAPRTPGRYVLTVTARDRAGNIGRRSLDLLVRER